MLGGARHRGPVVGIEGRMRMRPLGRMAFAMALEVRTHRVVLAHVEWHRVPAGHQDGHRHGVQPTVHSGDTAKIAWPGARRTRTGSESRGRSPPNVSKEESRRASEVQP